MTTINGYRAQNKGKQRSTTVEIEKNEGILHQKISQPVAVYWLSCHLSACHISKTFH